MWIDSIQGVYEYLPYLITLSSDLSPGRSLLPLFTSVYIICASLRPQRTGTLSSERNTVPIPGKGSQNGEGGVSAALLRTAVLAALLSSRRGGGDALSSDSKKYPSDLSFSL